MTFRPPSAPISPAVRWTLLRAFGPPDSPIPPGLAGGEAVEMARRFHVSERIAARVGGDRLARELGPEAAGTLAVSLRRSTVQSMRLGALLEEVCETASRLGIPVVFVKFAALQAQGKILAGARPAGDVDILVPGKLAERLQSALRSAGLVPGDFAPCGHHLVPLRSATNGVVELHHRLPGVRLRGRRSVGAEELLESGRVERLSGFPGECHAPSAEVHAAYLIVHGFVQHGPFPGTYSLLTVLGDLIDLEGSRTPGSGLRAGDVHRLIAREVPGRDVAGILGLCDRLRAGEPPEDSELLRHIVARTLSAEYQRKLLLRTLFPLSDEPKAVVFARTALRKLVPTASHLDDVYGVRTSRLGRMGRRLNRPLDLLFRAWRSVRPVETRGKIGENTERPREERGAR